MSLFLYRLGGAERSRAEQNGAERSRAKQNGAERSRAETKGAILMREPKGAERHEELKAETKGAILMREPKGTGRTKAKRERAPYFSTEIREATPSSNGIVRVATFSSHQTFYKVHFCIKHLILQKQRMTRKFN